MKRDERRRLRARLTELRNLRARVTTEIESIEAQLTYVPPPPSTRRRRHELEHGTDPGYSWHIRHHVPFPEDSGGEPCGCRAAHSQYEKNRWQRSGGR